MMVDLDLSVRCINFCLSKRVRINFILFLVFMVRHKILKSKFTGPAKLSMSLDVRWTKNISFCKFPAWLCPSVSKTEHFEYSSFSQYVISS